MRVVYLGSLIGALFLSLSACSAQKATVASAPAPPATAAEVAQPEPAAPLTCDVLYERLGQDAAQAAELTFSGPATISTFNGSHGVSVASAIVVYKFVTLEPLDDAAPAKGELLSTFTLTPHPNVQFKANALSTAQRVAPLKGQPYLLYMPTTSASFDAYKAIQVPLKRVDEAAQIDSLIRSGRCVKWS